MIIVTDRGTITALLPVLTIATGHNRVVVVVVSLCLGGGEEGEGASCCGLAVVASEYCGLEQDTQKLSLG